MSGQRLRLFVALELPGEVRQALVRWREPVLAANAGLRPLAAQNLHVTLCFLGWQPEQAVADVAAACHEVAPGEGIALSLGEAVWLPPRRPGVLAVRLRDEHGHLSTVQGRLSEVLQEGGWYTAERRPYLAHVTVARAGRQARVVPAPVPGPPDLSFTGSHLTLFRSRLSAAGARYESLASVSLLSTA